MKSGKLTNEELKHMIFDKLPNLGKNTIKGPGIGIDCAILKSKENLIAISSDPVTGASSDIGKIAINVSCNDIACCGIRPYGVVPVIIAPTNTTKKQLEEVINQTIETAKSLGVEIIGGHTEVSDAVNRFVITTTAFGFSDENRLNNTFNPEIGDAILMTKYAALEGTSILANDFEDKLKTNISKEDILIAKNLVNSISVINEGEICSNLEISSMHDATEGGIMGAVWEICKSANLGCKLDLKRIPVLQQTKDITKILGLNLYKLISSGSMIITTKNPQKVIDSLEKENIPCTAIGEIVEKDTVYIDLNGKIHELLPPGSDELYKMF